MDNAIRLGLMVPITGPNRHYGAEIVNSARIACAEINKVGGVRGLPIDLIVEDDGSLPDTALSAAVRLIDRHKCVALIGNRRPTSMIAVAFIDPAVRSFHAAYLTRGS